MRHIRVLTILSITVTMALIARPSAAIQLHWRSGADTMTFSAATRCTLVVQADSTESTLPAEWRLLWLSDSASLHFVAKDTAIACQADTTQATTIDGPATHADSIANLATAHFCSIAGPAAPTAEYVVDLPASSKGNFQVIAVDPNDSTAVIASSIVTFNGGVEGPFQPTILATISSHPTGQLTVQVVGANLGAPQAVSVVAPDGGWAVPLEITSQTGSTLAATADVAAPLPASVLQIVANNGQMVSAPLEPDALLAPSDIPSVASYIDPSGYIRPKDFSLFYDGLGQFHLFYIRHSTTQQTAIKNEKSFGHVWSNNLRTWSTPDTTSFRTRPGKWDDGHVWAPHIVQSGPTYYMFYTGVDSLTGNERIGIATTSNINTTSVVWTREETWRFSTTDASWTVGASPQHMRDPYVMPDPFNPTRYLMYYTAHKGGDTMSVGVARSTGSNLLLWTDIGPLPKTNFYNTFSLKAESPHAFLHINNNAAHDSTWYVLLTSAFSPGSIMLAMNRHNPIDPSQVSGPNNWTSVVRLYNYLGSDSRIADWNGSEYLRFFNHEYLAGYNAECDDTGYCLPDSNGIWIAQLQWSAGGGVANADIFSLASNVTAVGDEQDFGPEMGPQLRLVGPNPGREQIGLSIQLPTAMHVRLDVFDISGRRVKTLTDRALPPGRTHISWDGRTESGVVVGSGVFFARLNTTGEERFVRLVMLR